MNICLLCEIFIGLPMILTTQFRFYWLQYVLTMKISDAYDSKMFSLQIVLIIIAHDIQIKTSKSHLKA